MGQSLGGTTQPAIPSGLCIAAAASKACGTCRARYSSCHRDECGVLCCRLPLRVEASALPVAIQLLWDDQPLAVKEVGGEDGTTLVACISGEAAECLYFSGDKLLLRRQHSCRGPTGSNSVSSRSMAVAS
jgi:hypothetical protein